MRARAFLPVFLFAVCLPALGCIPHALPTTSPARSVEDKDKKEDAIKVNKVDLASEEKKKDAIKVDLSYLEKEWGIKYKSYETESTGTRYVGPEPHRGSKMRVKIVMEFTKDVENVKDLQTAFNSAALLFYFFDEDNVVLRKTQAEGTDEITGKKGDAFRVAVGITEASLKKTRKIVARPKEEEKDKAKK